MFDADTLAERLWPGLAVTVLDAIRRMRNGWFTRELLRWWNDWATEDTHGASEDEKGQKRQATEVVQTANILSVC